MKLRVLKVALGAALLGAALIGQVVKAPEPDATFSGNSVILYGDPTVLYGGTASEELTFPTYTQFWMQDDVDCPRHATDPCRKGLICVDTCQGWLFVCVEKDTWARVPYDRRW